jgi:Na+/H+-dicarboxylate symporter
MKRLGLLPLILLAIALGVLLGHVLPLPWVRLFATFNGVFSQFLGFMIPLIIVGLVTPAIADIGNKAGKLLLVTVAIAYADTIVAGLLAYGTGELLFPGMVEATKGLLAAEEPTEIAPYFNLQIPPMLDVMAALVLSFITGLGVAYSTGNVLRRGFDEFRTIISQTISKAIIPLLPLYIFGIFLQMTFTGQAYRLLAVFAGIIGIIFALHLFILLYTFAAAGALRRKNPLQLIWQMMPAYFTALGTASSAATIPVTLRQVQKNGVSHGVSGFVVPLCATIHMPGSAMKITACALTVCLLNGLPHGFALFLHFILLLGVCMVAGPGVPGGAVMAALAPLSSVLGFGADAQALIIALYIAMDSFGTACNVTADGALALVVDKYFKSEK